MIAPVIYTDRIPQRFAGMTFTFVILIRPAHRNDAGLHEHEKVHVRQFWLTWGLHPLLYGLSKGYRLRAEVEAYRVQLRFSPGNEELFAGFLATKYGLAVTPENALRLLKSQHSDPCGDPSGEGRMRGLT
jgi:hypothetical protein